MVIGNLNKSKETAQTALEDHYPKKSKFGLSKSTSECEDCAARFTS